MAAQEAAAMAAALGQWSTRQQAGAKIGVNFFNLVSSSLSGSSKRERNHHYTFEVDDNGVDINGFILHHNKHESKRHKFRVYLDSNENGRFDKNDQLIGRTGLKKKHAAKGVGNLLDEGEIGQLEVKFKTTKSNASMRDSDDIDGLSQSIGGGGGRIGSMSFSDSDASQIVSVIPLDAIISLNNTH